MAMLGEPSEEDIRLRAAYHEGLRRDGGRGQDLDDWIAAEDETAPQIRL